MVNNELVYFYFGLLGTLCSYVSFSYQEYLITLISIVITVYLFSNFLHLTLEE